MYILYGGSHTRALLVEMVLLEGGLPYELRPVDIVSGEHRSPEYLAVNPAGWVPALVTPEGQTLYETAAINLYLGERHGLDHLVPRIGDTERGPFLSGLFYVTDDIEPAMKRIFYPHRFAVREEDVPAVQQQATATAADRLGVVEQRLGKAGPYYLGERFSLIDIMVTFWSQYLERGGSLDGLAALRRCMDLVRERPRIAARFAEHTRDTDRYDRL